MSRALPWHEPVWQQLLQQRREHRMAHAYLLGGAEGSGKLHFARQLAAALLCRHPTGAGQHACGQCKACHLWQAGNHPDLLELEPEAPGKTIKIAQVRQLGDFVQQTASYQGSQRIIILSPAEALGSGAANALLKNLEEPPGNCLFLLISHVPGALLATIRSRCQYLPMPLPDAGAASQWLQAELPAVEATQALQLAPQQPLLALQLWHAGVPALMQQLASAEAALRSNPMDVVSQASALSGQNLRLVVQCLQRHLTDQLRTRMLSGMAAPQARPWLDFLQQLTQVLQQLDSGANLNPQLTLESLLLNWSERLLT